MSSLLFTIPSPGVSGDERTRFELPGSYERRRCARAIGGTGTASGVGEPIRPLRAPFRLWAGNPSFALRSPVRSSLTTPRRLDGTADPGGCSRTDDKPSRTARRVRSVPRVDHYRDGVLHSERDIDRL